MGIAEPMVTIPLSEYEGMRRRLEPITLRPGDHVRFVSQPDLPIPGEPKSHGQPPCATSGVGIDSETLIGTWRLPDALRAIRATLTAYHDGHFGAFVSVEGERMGYGTGHSTLDQAVAFIEERLRAELQPFQSITGIG